MSVNVVPRMALLAAILALLGLLVAAYISWFNSSSAEVLYTALQPAISNIHTSNTTVDLAFTGSALMSIEEYKYPLSMWVNYSILLPINGNVYSNVTVYNGEVNGSRLVIELIGSGVSGSHILLNETYVVMYIDSNNIIVEPRIFARKESVGWEAKTVLVDSGGTVKPMSILEYTFKITVEYYKFRNIITPSGDIVKSLQLGDGSYTIDLFRVNDPSFSGLQYTVDVYMTPDEASKVYSLFANIDGETYLLYDNIMGDLKGVNLAGYDFINLRLTVEINRIYLDIRVSSR